MPISYNNKFLRNRLLNELHFYISDKHQILKYRSLEDVRIHFKNMIKHYEYLVDINKTIDKHAREILTHYDPRKDYFKIEDIVVEDIYEGYKFFDDIFFEIFIYYQYYEDILRSEPKYHLDCY